MSNATKSLSAILLVLIAITLLVKWTGNRSSSAAFRSDIMVVDTTRIDRIVIDQKTAGKRVALTRSEGQWSVASGDRSYEADGDAVQRALSTLNNLQVISVATRDPGKFTRYKVDSTGTRVQLYDGDELLEGLFIGAPQILSRREFNSYVRPLDENTVYAVEGLLGSSFSTSADSWRNKVVWEYQPDEIERIDFLYPADSSFSMRRSGDLWVSGSDTLATGPVSSITSRLTSLEASAFADTLSTDRFGTERYAIQMQLEGGEQRTLRLKLPDEQSEQYLAAANDYPYLFLLRKRFWDQSILVSRESLIR